MISDRQMKRTLMIELFSTTGLFLSTMAQNLQQLAAGIAGAAVYAIYFYGLEGIMILRRRERSGRQSTASGFSCMPVFWEACRNFSCQTCFWTAAADGMYFFHCFYWHCMQTGEAGKSGARLMEALFWFIFLPLFLVLILAVKEIHFPFLMEGEFRPERSIRVFLCFCSLEILLFFQGKRKEKTKACYLYLS